MAIPWHRIFGMALTQYFAGSSWQVDVEVDLSVPVPAGKAMEVLGPKAHITFKTFTWS